MVKNFLRLWHASAIVIALALSGCGGSDSGPAGPGGTPGPSGPAGPSGPGGPAGTGSVNLAFVTPEQWQASKFQAAVTSVTVASPPVVEFTVQDEQRRPVEGLETYTTKRSGDTLSTYPNLGFALAKLMPRTDAKPSSWVSYMVTSVSSADDNGVGVVTGAGRPGTDNNGKLEAVADKPGTYKYTFRRDIPATKAAIDALTYGGNDRKADLGDLAWQPSLPHRLVIQIGGAARGTGSNTPDGTTSAAPVNMANPVNAIYDFVPATGQVLTSADLTREDVNIASCNVCHGKLAFHGGSARVETRYCVVCHTTQRAYGREQVASVAGKFPALTETTSVNAVTGITSYSYSPSTYVADGEVSGNFTTLIHKIHNGRELVKENYHYAGVVFNNKGFSKLGGGQRMCTTCHDSKIAATAENHKKLPSRQACGACHDGIIWETGGGSTLADKAAALYPGSTLATSGHVGRAQADDSRCALCHTPEYVQIDHRLENLTKNNTYILPGLATFRYDIKSATVNGSNDLVIEFGIYRKIAPSDTETLVTLVPPAPSVSASLAGFSGGPSFLLAYALPQDGLETPADYNNIGASARQAQPRSVSIANLLSTSNAANGNLVPSTTTTGYYKATILGGGAWAYPAGATLRAVALQGYYTQLNAPTDLLGGTGSVGRHAISVQKAVAGDTARRQVVDPAKCAGCHEWFEGHGGNRVYETQVCVFCHVPGLASSGRGISDATLATYIGANKFSIADNKILTEWDIDTALPNAALQFPATSNNFKDLIHGIHSGRERVTPFQDARDRTPNAITMLDFRRMDFPGKLNNCKTCHYEIPINQTVTSGQTSYNFVPGNALLSTHESINAAYAAGISGSSATTAQARASLSSANPEDKVITPFAASCVSCHDNTTTRAHVTINGGQVKVARGAVNANGESCAVCHGPGRDFDTAKVHNK